MSLGFDYLNAMLEDDREKGIYRCKREMFTDPRLFDLEMKHIFEGTGSTWPTKARSPRRMTSSP